MTHTTKSRCLFAKAQQLMPGGVNSPVRAFGSVGMEPIFIKRAKGAVIWDEDGNEYIDYVSSWGPMILGHANDLVLDALRKTTENGLSFGAPCRLEVELAGLITETTGIDMVRMVNSGTEAVMSALRLARGITGRDKIIKFAGCYHGHSDSMLVNAGSGALTSGVPSSAGVTIATASDTLTAEYNNLESVQRLFELNRGHIAALIVEPVAANMGVIPPLHGFLQGLRDLCSQHGALLIFDEVITGFRLALGGAAEYFGIRPDLVTYGKIIGGGLPVGAYGGRREYMDQIAPCGPVYQAGTLSGNPMAMAAGLCQLTQLQQQKDILYPELDTRCTILADGLADASAQLHIPVQINRCGSLCCGFFADQPVHSYSDALRSDTALYARFFAGMLEQGVYLAPSQFEAMFLSAAHTQEQISRTIKTAQDVLSRL